MDPMANVPCPLLERFAVRPELAIPDPLLWMDLWASEARALGTPLTLARISLRMIPVAVEVAAIFAVLAFLRRRRLGLLQAKGLVALLGMELGLEALRIGALWVRALLLSSFRVKVNTHVIGAYSTEVAGFVSRLLLRSGDHRSPVNRSLNSFKIVSGIFHLVLYCNYQNYFKNQFW